MIYVGERERNGELQLARVREQGDRVSQGDGESGREAVKKAMEKKRKKKGEVSNS